MRKRKVRSYSIDADLIVLLENEASELSLGKRVSVSEVLNRILMAWFREKRGGQREG